MAGSTGAGSTSTQRTHRYLRLAIGGTVVVIFVAVLAAVIVSTVANLLTPREMIGLWRVSRGDATIAWVTMIATLLTAPAIHYGLLAGLAAVAVRAVGTATRGTKAAASAVPSAADAAHASAYVCGSCPSRPSGSTLRTTSARARAASSA